MMSYLFTRALRDIYLKLWSWAIIFVNNHKENLALVNYYIPQPARFWEPFSMGVIREEIQTFCLPDSQTAFFSETH